MIGVASLTHWLATQRTQLLPAWLAAADVSAQTLAGAEQTLLLTAIYDGLIAATDGDPAPLAESLRLLRALRAAPGDDGLLGYLELLIVLRRAAAGAIDALPRDEREPLRAAFAETMDTLTLDITRAWVTSAKNVARELADMRLLVENLTQTAEETERTTLHVSRLNDLGQELSATFDPDAQALALCTCLHVTLDLIAVGFWLGESDVRELEPVAFRYPDDRRLLTLISFDDPDDLLARTYRDGEIYSSQSTHDVPINNWRLPGATVLAVPLRVQGVVIGVIALQAADTQLVYARAEQDFVRSAAGQTAIAMENARLYAEVRQFNAALEERIEARTRQLQIERDTAETLNTIAREIGSTLDEKALLESSLALLAELVGVRHGSIMLVDRETDQIVDRAVLGGGPVGFTRFPIGMGVVGWVAQHGKTALIPDVTLDPRWVDLPDAEITRKTSGSLIAVPLVTQLEVQGVIVLSHDRTGWFSEAHLRLLEAAATQLATGISNALLYKQVEHDLMRRYEMQQVRESELSRSNAILQSLSDGVIVCNELGSIMTVNPAAGDVLERSLEDLLIWNMPELINRLLGRRSEEIPVRRIIEGALSDKEPAIYTMTFQIGVRTVILTLNSVLSSDWNAPMGALAVVRDITREVESERLKNEFIGTVSHELRTPMTSIKGFTQLMLMGSLGPVTDTQKEFLSIIQSNAEKMIAIINDLLNITKFETGSVDLELRPLHVAEAISSVLLEHQPRIVERAQEFALQLPPGLPLVRADQKYFGEILSHLMSNAVKYTPRAGKITVRAYEVASDSPIIPAQIREGLRSGRYVCIAIQDTGVGVARAELDKIFERFYRTENVLKTEAGGTGLGLVLVRALIKLHGGQIWVESILDQGSTFNFVTPVA